MVRNVLGFISPILADFLLEENMANSRMSALGKKASVIREIFEYSLRRKAEIGADKVFDFSLGNPSIPAPKAVDDKIAELIEKEDSVALHGYTSAAGDLETRKTIAGNIEKRFGVKADFSDIYMTCGAAASLTITLKAICENENDEVILLAPFFPEYNVFASNAGAKAVTVGTKDKSFKLDFDAIKAAVNKNTAAIIINSPNNPTGAVVSREEAEQLGELLRSKSEELCKPIYLIADEPYRELSYGKEVPYLPKYYENTIVCYSYSKSLSLPGERIGYIFVPKTVSNATDIFAAVCGAGRSMGYVCAPSLMQRVVMACDGMSADISLYDRNRRLLFDSLTEMGYEAVKPEGAFYLFVKALESDANAFCERARAHELLLVPSDSFGVSGYVRISYCVSYDMIKRSLPAFKNLYEEYQKGE